MNMVNNFQHELLQYITSPLCVADGGAFGEHEDLFILFLNELNIEYTPVQNLYTKPIDLSTFKTIAFFTTGAYANKVQELLAFDKSNLKCVVVLSEWAYDIVRELGERLNIKVIGYDWLMWDLYKKTGDERFRSAVLFYPVDKW